MKSKSFELHTLCGVRVMYLCREENGTHHSWPPQNSAHLKSLIDHYREMGSPKDNIFNKATKCPQKSKAVAANKLSPHQEATTKSPEPVDHIALLPNQEAVDTDLIDNEFANHFWSVDQPPLLSNQEAMGNSECAWSVDHAVTPPPPPPSNQEAIENDLIGNEFANHVWSWSSQVAANQIATTPSLPPVAAPLNQYQEEEEELAVLAPLPQALTMPMNYQALTTPWHHPSNYRWNHQSYNARDYGMCC